MSCLVSYSESSDEDDGQSTSISDINRHSFVYNQESSKSTCKHSSLLIESSDDTSQEHSSQLQDDLKAAQLEVTKPYLLTKEGKISTLQSRRKRKLDSSKKDSLELPSSIQKLYQNKCQVLVDDPALHQNRVRSFPHEVGNWATHIFISVPQNNHFLNFVGNLMKLLLPEGFELLPEFHVSLSRTVVIRHHWIEPLVESLKEKLQHISTSVCEVIDVKIFLNDEKTRSFVCLELSEDDTELLNYVKAVDDCFEDFKLAPYYKNPSFHISVGWCLGDVTSTVSSERLSKAKTMLSEFLALHSDLRFLYAHQIHCRIGNKSFVIALKESSCDG